MAIKLSPLAKLLAKIEKVQKKHASDPCYTGGDFYDLDSYSSYIRKELKLKKNSDLYIIDMEEKNYMDFFYETLMHYVGKDVSIQVNQTWVDTCDGEYDIIVQEKECPKHKKENICLKKLRKNFQNFGKENLDLKKIKRK